MDKKTAKKIVKIIKSLDLVMWELNPSESRVNLADSRFQLYNSLNNSGWNFDRNYNLFKLPLDSQGQLCYWIV